VTARVARLSFCAATCKSGGGETTDWTRRAQLPLVEGDDDFDRPNALVEIQFDSSNHLRLAENSFLKLTTLKTRASPSPTAGTLSLRLLRFREGSEFFRDRCARTTLSIEKAGCFALTPRRRSVANRVRPRGRRSPGLLGDSGFTLRSGRTAKSTSRGLTPAITKRAAFRV
jgi:hypothetical protein